MLAPATSEVACSGAKHRIEWRDGKLQLLDHDVEAEKTLAVLGSDLPRCVGILEAWHGFEVDPFDPRMLVALLAEDALSDRARAQLHTKYGIRATDTHSFKLAWSLGSHDKVRKMVGQARHFLALYTLPDDLRKRFALDFVSKAIDSWGKRGFKKRHFPAFELLVNLIAERSFRRTISNISESLGIGVPVPVKWRVLDPGASPHFSGLITRSTVRYETRLPISWLSNVWVRSLDVVDGTFILQAEESESESIEALAVRWTADSPESFKASMTPARLEQSEKGWGLSWVSAS